VLLGALDLMSDPEATYTDGTDAIRRNLNETFYQRIFLDDLGVQASDLNPPFDEFHAALATTRKTSANATAASTKQGPRAGASDRATIDHSSSGLALTLTDMLSGAGSSKTSLVELRGFEPLTPTLPVWCATNCAIAPRCACRSYTTVCQPSKSLIRLRHPTLVRRASYLSPAQTPRPRPLPA
jgi:site-specific DNA recombinase